MSIPSHMILPACMYSSLSGFLTLCSTSLHSWRIERKRLISPPLSLKHTPPPWLHEPLTLEHLPYSPRGILRGSKPLKEFLDAVSLVEALYKLVHVPPGIEWFKIPVSLPRTHEEYWFACDCCNTYGCTPLHVGINLG